MRVDAAKTNGTSRDHGREGASESPPPPSSSCNGNGSNCAELGQATVKEQEFLVNDGHWILRACTVLQYRTVPYAPCTLQSTAAKRLGCSFALLVSSAIHTVARRRSH